MAQQVKNPPVVQEMQVQSLGQEDPLKGKGGFPERRKWQPMLVFLPGKSHGQRSLVGYAHGVARVRLSD